MRQSCRICGNGTAELSLLTDGSSIHLRCYSLLLQDIDQARARLSRLDKRYSGFHGVISRIVGLLLNVPSGEAASFPDHAQSLREEMRSKALLVASIHDHWPTYPPDWETRRLEALSSRGSACEKCGSGGILQLHHKVPLYRGGSNLSDNLTILCESCHQAEHGGRVFGRHRQQADTAFVRKLDAIAEALCDPAARLVFRYEKFDGTVTKREVTPERIGTPEGDFRSENLCLFGFCHLRGDRRAFAVHRMKGLKVKTRHLKDSRE